MTREGLEEAKNIVLKLDDIENRLSTIETIESFVKEDKGNPTMIFEMFGAKLNISCNDEQLKKIYCKFLKDVKSMYNKRMTELEKQFEKI